MSQHGAALQTFNIELVKTVEELKRRQQVLAEETAREERHRQQLERQAAELQSQLDRCTASLRHKQQLSKEYNRIIAEAEGAYQKILESSQALLSVVKRETSHLSEAEKAEQKNGREMDGAGDGRGKH
ncbi:Sjoegren syndrome nuclear autoantigen 1 homolog [Amphibalanus amphitrite]|uniref:Sjoegren syndrome nuclear autoantigen 1 homolog n=1 Tax=Amphibalanus amphitrite TaxID=1232801 RepID=UPI001C90F8D9|nr:Sjoegren syndrome nuclear autoantigen 1 homolog [Amphibalanus amphitrite]